MSKLTSARAGIPSAKGSGSKPTKFRGFRRLYMATNKQMEDCIARIERGLPATGIWRTWREGEPIIWFGGRVFVRRGQRMRHSRYWGELRA